MLSRKEKRLRKKRKDKKPEDDFRVTRARGKVYMEKGVTRNMGDFNSARVTVGMELPIDYTASELKSAIEAIETIDLELTKELDHQLDEMDID